MQAAQLTLAAAIRDATATRAAARDTAIANLAPALLAELGRAGPAWQAASDHPRGREVTEALLATAKDDEVPASRRGMAAIALGTLGDPQVIGLVHPWLDEGGEAVDAVFLRECALIGVSFVGSAAPEHAEPRRRALGLIREAMKSSHADVRFQAAIALVEVAGNDAEPELCNALSGEDHVSVRDNLVEAIGRLDPPGHRACRALEALIAGPDGQEAIGFSAARALADARHSSARPRLLQALVVRAHRDLALEALAALGAATPEECEQVFAIARRWWLPAVTRVRASYALVRMLGEERRGEAMSMLERFAWHPRPAVREAVADARAALATLAQR